MLLTTEEVKPCLQHVNSLLNNAILKCKTTIGHVDKSTSIPQPFTNKQKFHQERNLTTNRNSRRLLIHQAGKNLQINRSENMLLPCKHILHCTSTAMYIGMHLLMRNHPYLQKRRVQSKYPGVSKLSCQLYMYIGNENQT